jgi:REP element-mobilizing transposase RayT
MHSFVGCYVHCVFSTKQRLPLITEELQERLWPYLGGIARENKMKALCVGGVADHVHVLLSVPSTLAVAKAVQLLKGNSSKWIHETFPGQSSFAWQEGYGAFSIGVSGIPDTMAYIQGQAEHHRKKTFQEEFIAFLKKHGMEYDEAALWE